MCLKSAEPLSFLWSLIKQKVESRVIKHYTLSFVVLHNYEKFAKVFPRHFKYLKLSSYVVELTILLYGIILIKIKVYNNYMRTIVAQQH